MKSQQIEHQIRKLLVIQVMTGCALLTLLTALLDVNQCELHFLNVQDNKKESYFNFHYKPIVHEAVELDTLLNPQKENLLVLMGLFLSRCTQSLSQTGSRILNKEWDN